MDVPAIAIGRPGGARVRRLPALTILPATAFAAIVAAVAPSCGLMSGVCNDFCAFNEECSDDDEPGFCDNDVSESQCVDACKTALDEISDAQRQVLEECVACIEDIDEDDRCADHVQECDDCATLYAAEEGFMEEFSSEIGNGDCGYYGGYDLSEPTSAPSPGTP
jgi:hypothetical protein